MQEWMGTVMNKQRLRQNQGMGLYDNIGSSSGINDWVILPGDGSDLAWLVSFLELTF